MSDDEFNPRSVDAMLAQILAQQKADSAKLMEALEAMKTQEKRIAHLEQFKYWLMGAAVAAGIVFDWAKELVKGNHQ